MKIGIDVDNVIADSVPTLIAEANKYFKTNFTYNDIYIYDFHKILGVSREEMSVFMKKIFSEKVPLRCKTIKGAKEAIHKIKENYEIYIVSSRRKEFKADTIEWLNNNDIPYDFVEHVTDKQKHIYAIDKGIEVFIEDDLEQAISLAENGIKVFLFDHPWNRAGNIQDGYMRVKSWDEILENL